MSQYRFAVTLVIFDEKLNRWGAIISFEISYQKGVRYQGGCNRSKNIRLGYFDQVTALRLRYK